MGSISYLKLILACFLCLLCSAWATNILSTSDKEPIEHMISYLGGGRCEEVAIDDLLMDPSLEDSLLVSQMDEKRKRLAFQLCSCYWRRVRRDSLVSCTSEELKNQVDTCIGRIDKEEARMDYWQRFLEVNRWIFQLNQNILSEQQHRKFALMSENMEGLSQLQQSSLHLADQQEATSRAVGLALSNLAQIMEGLSERLLPLQQLFKHLAQFNAETIHAFNELANTSREVEDTIGTLFLVALYFVCYLLLHASTAFIFGGSRVYIWQRKVTLVIFLADWLFIYKRPGVSLVLAVSGLPVAILISLVEYLQNRSKSREAIIQDQRVLEQVEQEGLRLEQWIEALTWRRAHDSSLLKVTPTLSSTEVNGSVEESERETEPQVAEKRQKPKKKVTLASPQSRRRRVRPPQ